MNVAPVFSGSATEQHLPQVVVFDQSGLLGRHDDLFAADRPVNLFQHRRLEILAAVDFAQIAFELVHRHGDVLPLDVRVVLVDIEHDDGVGQREGRVGIEERGVVALVPVVGELLHQKGNQRRLAGQTERLQVKSQRFVDADAVEIERMDESFQDVQVLAVADVFANHLLLQSRAFPEEDGHFGWVQRIRQEPILLQELDALGWFRVELLSASY